MRRFVVGLAVGFVALVVLTQLLLPPFLEERVANRLTEDGGSAEVSLSAFPAVRLLWGDGKRFEEQVFSRLDGFEEVRVEVNGLEVEGVDASRFTLTRLREGDPYRLSMRGQVSGREAIEIIGSEAAGPLGSIAGGLAGSALPGAGTELPLTVDADLASREGRAEVVRTDATVAGLPAGPIAQLVVDAVVKDL
jgi:hypothetical protein